MRANEVNDGVGYLKWECGTSEDQPDKAGKDTLCVIILQVGARWLGYGKYVKRGSLNHGSVKNRRCQHVQRRRGLWRSGVCGVWGGKSANDLAADGDGGGFRVSKERGKDMEGRAARARPAGSGSAVTPQGWRPEIAAAGSIE